jgi:dolichol kinase
MSYALPHEGRAAGLASVLRREAARKTIHLTGLAVPAIYLYTPRPVAIVILAALTATSIAIDSARHRHDGTASIFNGLFDRILRVHERDRVAANWNAVSWFFIAATVSAAVFPKYITIASITMSLPADAASALIGIVFGKHRVGTKSLEGSAAFFVVALLAGVAMPRICGVPGEYVIAVSAALVGTIVELACTRRVDDNLATPLSIAACLWLSYKWAFPAVDLNLGG